MRTPSDAGVATVWSAMAVALLLSVTVLVVELGAAISVRHRAEAAADLAALAAAASAAVGEVASCSQARRVTDRNSVELTGCHVAGWDAFIEVRADLPAPLSAFDDATARARAGRGGG